MSTAKSSAGSSKRGKRMFHKAAIRRSKGGRSLSIARKGHFVAYTIDRERFMLPLRYLDNCVIRKLLDVSEKEFGHPRNGPIIFPCDAIFMDYLILVIESANGRIPERSAHLRQSSYYIQLMALQWPSPAPRQCLV
ncbi:hypothetical protein MLD38_013596 [Melastoma candidum]|uniref:Uncharacterized protein n=1 Tax=Melastoma candidum TaxID=119954 RepID=A0ACB9RDR2_9MYRT|nr:hypothetical protein MLD38_013596 [Melastoma candidum]